MTIIDRYQDYRVRAFLEHQRRVSTWLPGWRTRRRRRILVSALALTFVAMFAVGVWCHFDMKAALAWLPAMLLFVPLWSAVQIVSGRRADAPADTLDEYEIAQRNAARSIGFTVTHSLVLIPIAYLIIGSVITDGKHESMAYAGGLMALTTLLAGAAVPACVLAWTRPDDPEPDLSEVP